MKSTLLLACVLILLPVPACRTPEPNQPPMGYITSLSPAEVTEGETVRFVGYGTDADGRVVGYRWSSNLDGELSNLPSFETNSLSVGDHVISFMVQDNNDAWSAEVRGTVRVLAPVVAPATIHSFAASLATITAGDSVTLSWNVSNASAVSINQEIGAVTETGTATISPEVTTTYKLTATGGGVTEVAEVTVTVVALEPELAIVFFEANPVAVPSGEECTLSWQTTGAVEVQIVPTIGVVEPAGSAHMTVHGEEMHTFTLIATDGETIVTAEVEVQSYLLMPNSYTIELTAVIEESGCVRSIGQYWAEFMYVGDDNQSIGIQGFVSFDISSIPDDAIITSVVVDLSNHETLYGTPFDDLGCLQAYVHDYGTLDGGDYVPEPFDDPVIGIWCSHDDIETPGGGSTPGFKDALQEKVGQSRFQIRLQFELATDNDDDSDLVRWSGTKLPRLNVHYYSFE